MKKNSIVKFDEIEMDMLTSKKELQDINGGNVITSILKSIGIDVNNNCHGCNNCH